MVAQATRKYLPTPCPLPFTPLFATAVTANRPTDKDPEFDQPISPCDWIQVHWGEPRRSRDGNKDPKCRRVAFAYVLEIRHTITKNESDRRYFLAISWGYETGAVGQENAEGRALRREILARNGLQPAADAAFQDLVVSDDCQIVSLENVERVPQEDVDDGIFVTDQIPEEMERAWKERRNVRDANRVKRRREGVEEEDVDEDEGPPLPERVRLGERVWVERATRTLHVSIGGGGYVSALN